MNKGTCKNCGGDYGIHKWDNFQCPFGGREAPFPRKTEYINSYFEEENDEIETLRAQVATQAVTIAKLREALAGLIYAIIYVCGGGYVGNMKRRDAEDKALEKAKQARAILEETK